jgi:hypothetical protein
MATQPSTLEIRWSQHAIERAVKRFGFDESIKVPNGLMQQIGARKNVGEDFRIRVGMVIYICARTHDCILVVTVMKHNKNGKVWCE